MDRYEKAMSRKAKPDPELAEEQRKTWEHFVKTARRIRLGKVDRPVGDAAWNFAVEWARLHSEHPLSRAFLGALEARGGNPITGDIVVMDDATLTAIELLANRYARTILRLERAGSIPSCGL